MKKFAADFIIIASTLIFIVSVTLYFTRPKLITEKESLKSSNLLRNIYIGERGYPIYTSGTCINDSDCTPSGCSNQICSNDPDLVTTCEIRNDFPDRNIYSCGCIEEHCVWYK